MRDIILEMINRDNACSKTKDTKKKDNKPDTKKKGNKPDTKKKDNKPDTKKKDNKPDTSKNNIENRASNRIKYEIQDIAKYRKVLIRMIHERIYILDLMNMQLSESIDNTDIVENSRKFDRLCHACKIDIIPEYKETISGIYVVNVALECLRDGMGNGIWPKGISHSFIPIINKKIKKDYDIKYIGKKLIEKTRREIGMVRGLIEANMRKYERIIENAGEMDIYSLDHA